MFGAPGNLWRGCASATVVAAGAVSFGAQDLSLLDLKKLSLEELVEQEVTIASRRPQQAGRVPSAVDVIGQEQIRRSGALTIPDVLRLATGMHVAQSDRHTWAITARGFNAGSATANKMQVMMDGRSLYSPLFSGVFWDAQHYLLEDIERIEVVRGPGATMWGANAFNGVINIITKEAEQTQGVLVMGGGGTEAHGFGGVRYGGELGERTFYRAYATVLNFDDLSLPNGGGAGDDWMLGQTGFRADSALAGNNYVTLQGDYYSGEFGRRGATDGRMGGGNLLGRWTHEFAEDSELVLQAYFDKTHRNIPGLFEENRNTFDLDASHSFLIGERNAVIWGVNYRLSSDKIGNPNPGVLAFVPSERNLQLFSAFVQDEITLVEEKLTLTVGSKFEHNDYTGFEVQPSARLAYTPTEDQTFWAGVSRAVRTPSRIDGDFRVPGVVMNDEPGAFHAEELLALEFGYRVQPVNWFSLDLAAFYNDYSDLRSFEPVAGGDPVARNELEGHAHGVEIGAHLHVFEPWRVRASYTWFDPDLEFTDESRAVLPASTEGNDPSHMFKVHSSLNLPFNLEFDQVLRYVDELPDPHVPAYLELDLRLAWLAREGLELAVIGRNLLDDQHPEIGANSPFRPEIERSVYGKVTWRF